MLAVGPRCEGGREKIPSIYAWSQIQCCNSLEELGSNKICRRRSKRASKRVEVPDLALAVNFAVIIKGSNSLPLLHFVLKGRHNLGSIKGVAMMSLEDALL